MPKDKAIIFAANHPTAFLDPVILGSYLEHTTHFIVRGDVFKGKFILALLNGLKMLPIFRFRDGFSSLKNNQATMETVYEKLAEKRCVLILAEGETKHEKRLRPIQKGTARMAFGTFENHGDEDILIVPVGVNYTNSHAYRSYVMTEIGAPIHLKDYRIEYNENPRKAINVLTARLEEEMRALVIHIENEADEQWINRLLEIKRNDVDIAVFPILSHKSTLWEKEFNAVEKLNAFSPEQKLNKQNQLKVYDQQLRRLNVSDLGVTRASRFNFLNTLFLVLGFILFLIGAITNFLPLFIAETVAKKKVKKIEFYSSVRYATGLISYLIYWLVLFIISLLSGKLWLIGLVIIIPFLGYFAQVYLEIFKTWNEARKFVILNKTDQKELQLARKDMIDF